MMLAIVGLMPALHRRLIILTRSGIAAKVVPKPATKPTISERLNDGANRLCVSWMPMLAQPPRTSAPDSSTTNAIIRFRQVMFLTSQRSEAFVRESRRTPPRCRVDGARRAFHRDGQP